MKALDLKLCFVLYGEDLAARLSCGSLSNGECVMLGEGMVR